LNHKQGINNTNRGKERVTGKATAACRVFPFAGVLLV